jgi:hypothetical protein
VALLLLDNHNVEAEQEAMLLKTVFLHLQLSRIRTVSLKVKPEIFLIIQMMKPTYTRKVSKKMQNFRIFWAADFNRWSRRKRRPCLISMKRMKMTL